MSTRQPKLNKEIIVFVLFSIAPFLFWIFKRFIFLDFWYDEIFCMKRWIFGKMSIVFGELNHTLFILTVKVYLKIIQTLFLDKAKTYYQLLEKPLLLRMLMLFFALITIVAVYKICKKFFNNTIAHLSTIIMVTTVPFLNFSVQVRGYILGMMFLYMMIYYLWSYESDPKKLYAVFIVIFATAALYSTASVNLYFILSIMVFYFVVSLLSIYFNRHFLPEMTKRSLISVSYYRQRSETFLKNRYIVICFLLLLSIVLTGLLYLPTYNNIMNNQWIVSNGFVSHIETLKVMFPKSIVHFFSKRYLLIIFIIGGVFNIFYESGEELKIIRKKWFFGFSVLILPFIFSFLRGDSPFYRVFISLAPMFSMFAAMNIYYFFRKIRSSLRISPILLIIFIMIYSNLTLFFAFREIDKKLEFDINFTNSRSHDSYYNYFQSFYRPQKLIKEFRKKNDYASVPIFVYKMDEVAFPEYLRMNHIKYRRIYEPEEVLNYATKKAIIFTANPNYFICKIIDHKPNLNVETINANTSYHNILFIEKSNDNDSQRDRSLSFDCDKLKLVDKAKHKLTILINPNEAGEVKITPKDLLYADKEVVHLEAVARQSYSFSNWSGDINNLSKNVIDIYMIKDRKIIANFEKVKKIN